MYALNLDADGRVLSATFPKYAPADAVKVDKLPDGNLYDYRYENGDFVYDPVPEPEPEENIDPQADTDAMLVDHEYRLTILELFMSE